MAERDAGGKFKKGVSGNPAGRPKVPEDIKKYGREAPERLRKIADDPKTSPKIKADIERWFAEMTFGKPTQQVDFDGEVKNTGVVAVKFEGELEEWSK